MISVAVAEVTGSALLKKEASKVFTSEATVEKIRNRKRQRDVNAKERDKRRRKMIVD